MVAELDSALNQWIDSVPTHRTCSFPLLRFELHDANAGRVVRWDPRREDPDFLSQSAFLYSTYYELQIVVHRQYIPSPKKTLSLPFPSLAICANAARSLVHIVEVQHERSPIHSYQYMVSKNMFCGFFL